MKISLCFTLLFVHYLYASNVNIHFDPDQLEMSSKLLGPIKNGTQSVMYREYYYGQDKKPVFRVGNGLTPQINCLITKAKEDHNYVGLKNITKIYFLDQKSITDNFYIKKSDKSINDNWIIVNPKSMILKKKKNEDSKYSYYIILIINDIRSKYEIKKSMFTAFKLSITLAVESDKFISINIQEMLKAKPDAEKCINVVNKINDDNQCLICLDQVKNTVFEPCCHLCTCENCAKQLSNCPLCRTNIKNNIKIFR